MQKKKSADPLLALKYRGYCWSQTPPGDNTTLEDLVSFAKFYLCKHSRLLWKDPMWDEYTNEEILVEYFAHLFSTDESMRREFEVEIDAGTNLYGEEIYEWLDKKVKENQEEAKAKLDSLPEKISFSPDAGTDLEE